MDDIKVCQSVSTMSKWIQKLPRLFDKVPIELKVQIILQNKLQNHA